MIKKLAMIFCSFLLGIALLTPASAKERPKVIQRTGEVVTIDAAAKSMTIKYRNDTIIITLTDSTLVKMQRERKNISDIKIGDLVTVWFFEKDKTAKSIDIKRENPAAEAVKK
jgi:Cu/Ag efflux protein CusF